MPEWYEVTTAVKPGHRPIPASRSREGPPATPSTSSVSPWTPIIQLSSGAGTNGTGTSFGVFKSTDGGDTWTAKNTGMALNGELGMIFRGFTIQKGNSDIVYAQAEISTTVQGLEFNRVKGRVYKTTDGGASWRLIWEGDNLARYLIIDPVNTNLLYLSTGIFDREAFNSDCAKGRHGGVGVLKSLDGGHSWTAINSGLDDLYVGSLRMHPTKPHILFAATGNNACSGNYSGYTVSGLFMTMNGGASWAKVIANDVVTTVNFSPSTPDIVYAGSSSAFYRSEDGGTTWSRFSQSGGNASGWGPPGIRAGVPIDVTIDGDNPFILYANNYGGGVFRSLDGAETWQVWSKGYSGAEIHIVHAPITAPARVYAIGRSGPYTSLNHGEDWIGIANGAPFAEWNAITTQPSNTNTVLIADEHQGVILYSGDGGNNFREILRHPDAHAAVPGKRQGFRGLTFAPSNPSVVYAGLSKDRNTFLSSVPIGTVVYKSQNGGLSFSPLPSALDGSNVRRMLVDPADDKLVYAATTNGVYKSIDGAASWTRAGDLGVRSVEALAIDPLQPGYIIAGEIFGGIWMSTNGGANWTGPLNSGFNSSNPYITALVVDPVSPNTVFAGDLYSGIYRSLDKGLSWTPFPDWKMSGLSVRAVTDIAMGTRTMYAATQGGGVFKFDRQAEVTRSQVTEIYVATFGRAPDTAGLAYWVGQVGAGHLSIDQVAQSFFDQPETKTKYPQGTTHDVFLTTIYQNVLNREPDLEGLHYWEGELGRGAFSRSQAIMAIINGAKAATGSPADAAILANKEQVGEYFAASPWGSLSDSAKMLMLAQEILDDIDSDPESVSAAKTKIDTLAR